MTETEMLLEIKRLEKSDYVTLAKSLSKNEITARYNNLKQLEDRGKRIAKILDLEFDN